VKRLAASFILAARSNGFSKSNQRDAAQACAQSYREHMHEFAKMGTLEVWYQAVDIGKVLASVHDKVTRARVRKRVKKAQARTVAEHDFPTLAAASGGKYVIKDNPPLIYHHQLLDLAENRDCSIAIN
jgi:hypothetical protein